MGKMLKKGIPKTATHIDDPKTIEERREVARQCEQTLQYGMRTYVDEIDLLQKARDFVSESLTFYKNIS